MWGAWHFFFFFFFLPIHTATPSIENYEHAYIVHTSFAGWKPTSNHVNYCRGWLSRHRGPPVHTYLASSLQMTLRKACSDTEIFPLLPRGSNPRSLALKASALTTRLPRFPTGCRCLNKNKNGTFFVLESAQRCHRLRLENYQKNVISVFGKLHVPVPLHFWKNEDFFYYIWEKYTKLGKIRPFLHWEYLP